MTISAIGGFNLAALGAPKSQNRQNLPGNFLIPSGPEGAPAPAGPTNASSAKITAAPKNKDDDVIQQFNDYMKQTPAERFQSAWLARHGISKAEFDAMSPAEKQALMDEMRQEIEQKLKQQTEDQAQKKTDILA